MMITRKTTRTSLLVGACRPTGGRRGKVVYCYCVSRTRTCDTVFVGFHADESGRRIRSSWARCEPKKETKIIAAARTHVRRSRTKSYHAYGENVYGLNFCRYSSMRGHGRGVIERRVVFAALIAPATG